MKLSQLKSIVKGAVKEAIQEEMKDILLEAVRSPKQPVVESTPSPQTPTPPIEKTREELRESYRNILGETAAGFNSSMVGKPLQVNGPVDTTSPNGKLPDGEVGMDQIMNLMNKK